MENKTQENKTRGLRIRTLNACMIIVSCIIFSFLISCTAVMPSQYRKLITSTNEYIACAEDASSLSIASDYLTEQVQLYVQNMDIVYMQRYFEEVNETRRREKALEELNRHDISDSIRTSLEAALQSSNDLMNREIYAMKLISEANEYDEDLIPAEVKSIPLEASDLSLTSAQKIEKARNLVFGEEYLNAKAQIRSHLSRFTDELLLSLSQRQLQCESILGNSLSRKRLLVCLLFIMNVITFAAISILIVRPLTIHIKRIQDNKHLEIIGSYEFKFLALTYNNIYELNAANQNMLIQKAEHDPLTGIMNRSAYDKIQAALKDSTLPVALALLDVDQFKQVNDRNGHEAGDAVLKAVAAAIRRSFRPGDYVIRMGGDEFAVILPEMERTHFVALEKKIALMNQFLQNPNEDLPPVSLSAGVAFSDHGFRDELYFQADQALYYTKEHGRCGCHAFESESHPETSLSSGLH